MIIVNRLLTLVVGPNTCFMRALACSVIHYRRNHYTGNSSIKSLVIEMRMCIFGRDRLRVTRASVEHD